MSMGNAGTVLRAECWRPQLAYADFMNDGLLLAAFTKGVCVQSPCTYRGILLLSSFSNATFLPWEWWDPRYLAMIRRNNFKSHAALGALALSLGRQLLFSRVRKNSMCGISFWGKQLLPLCLAGFRDWPEIRGFEELWIFSASPSSMLTRFLVKQNAFGKLQFFQAWN